MFNVHVGKAHRRILIQCCCIAFHKQLNYGWNVNDTQIIVKKKRKNSKNEERRKRKEKTPVQSECDTRNEHEQKRKRMIEPTTLKNLQNSHQSSF